MIKKLIQWTEQGIIPDIFIRAGIRRLCRARLRDVDQGDCESNQLRLEKLLEKFRHGEIAPLPEKANEQHYEVPAEFYELVLGSRKKYSCCYYPKGNESLDEAEILGLEQTCERAQLRDGQAILELGCGWGSLTLWMAEKYPNANITAVSNSRSQREYILNQAENRGVDRNLTVITCDMNDFDIETRFDRVVSVEMFEHMRNYEQLLKNISRWLNEDGKLFVHIFCHRDLTYEFQDKGESDWMSRYFFSGGIMPGDSLLYRFGSNMQISRQWRWRGSHYQQTSEHWLQNADRNKDAILGIFGQCYGADQATIWFHRWRLFFLAVAELFGMDDGQQWWVSHYLFERPSSSNVAANSDLTHTWQDH